MLHLEKREITLSTGQTALIEYDPHSDLLEIVFGQGEATGAVELTESIVLRFDRERLAPLSLSLMNSSQLAQPSEYGEVHFQLLTNEWPAEAKDKILAMLREAPLNEFLTLGSYVPAHTHRVIPLATIKYPQLSALTA